MSLSGPLSPKRNGTHCYDKRKDKIHTVTDKEISSLFPACPLSLLLVLRITL